MMTETRRWSEDSEKRAIAEAMAQLDDVRKFYKNNDLLEMHVLVHSQPKPYDATTIRERLRQEQSNEEVAKDMRAIDLCLVVGRYLHSLPHDYYRQHPDDAADHEEIQRWTRNEETCILAKLMWKHFEPTEKTP